MSNEERQRIIRRAGSEPAEAEEHEHAAASREAKAREDAEAQAGQRGSTDEATPLAEEEGEPPRPRR
jgi:hypothetical protein